MGYIYSIDACNEVSRLLTQTLQNQFGPNERATVYFDPNECFYWICIYITVRDDELTKRVKEYLDASFTLKSPQQISHYTVGAQEELRYLGISLDELSTIETLCKMLR